MTDLYPNFQVRVWKYTYAGDTGLNTIILNSPQESEKERYGTFLVRQTNSDAENKVWVEEQPLRLRRCTVLAEQDLADNSHGVIVRDGETTTIAKPKEVKSFHRYRRGDRIWVCGLAPTYKIAENNHKIPVVSLDSYRMFEIPFKYICFVPDLKRLAATGEYHAAVGGPILNTFQGKRKTKSRIYFTWPVDRPADVSFTWLDKNDKDDAKTMHAFKKIQDPEKRRQAFHSQWCALTGRLADLGLLTGDDAIDWKTDRSDSSSTVSSQSLRLQWKPAQSSFCNLDPCPDRFNPELDLVPSVEHYHIQDDDQDACPRGAEHRGHCILRDHWATCAYSTDRARHTCCRLRWNPPLPPPDGDPDDPSIPLWESRAAGCHFVDVSNNVRTRCEREDRDEIPPQLDSLWQQKLQQTRETTGSEDSRSSTLA